MVTSPQLSEKRPALPLAVTRWGDGPSTAVLVHGMMSDSTSWWQIGPQIAARGYAVTAVDLPGHGGSPASASADMDVFVESLLAAVPAEPDLVVAHSMGAFVVAAALHRLRPKRVVFVDTPFGPSHEIPDPAAVQAGYEKARARRTREHLDSKYPDWAPEDRAAEAGAAARFDVATAVSLLVSAAGRDLTPDPEVPTLMVHAAPSRNVKPELAAQLAERGWTVRSIEGADHIAWFGRGPEFVDALRGWL